MRKSTRMSDEIEILGETKKKSRWMTNKEEYNRKYRNQRTRCIAFRLRTREDEKYIKIYQRIPNKIEFLRQCLDAYDKGTFKFGKN